MTEKSNMSIEQLQQRIILNPADAEAYSLLGNALSEQHCWQKSALAFEEAFRLNPKDSHAELALCMLISGPEPLVEPSMDLLKFLGEQGGSIAKVFGLEIA